MAEKTNQTNSNKLVWFALGLIVYSLVMLWFFVFND